ncbi:hypothetical protein HPB50_018931 [Hyalomma asiaticum]|uniref:Uncharacterized protein n=1 Tax=Hyalomma asiaticum TaxID=266040 RepID=A0ACB7STT4_HYAAI|nr:hypothetical protein HPB50_018931 [Hyalomma asiaticum]
MGKRRYGAGDCCAKRSDDHAFLTDICSNCGARVRDSLELLGRPDQVTYGSSSSWKNREVSKAPSVFRSTGSQQRRSECSAFAEERRAAGGNPLRGRTRRRAPAGVKKPGAKNNHVIGPGKATRTLHQQRRQGLMTRAARQLRRRRGSKRHRLKRSLKRPGNSERALHFRFLNRPRKFRSSCGRIELLPGSAPQQQMSPRRPIGQKANPKAIPAVAMTGGTCRCSAVDERGLRFHRSSPRPALGTVQ